MPRLFVTPKEIQLINDWTKEIVKDIVGQTIKYYAISVSKSNVHDVYNESVNKVFEPPVDLDVLADQVTWEVTHTKYGSEKQAKIEIFVQARDLIDKGLTLCDGDFFTYGQVTYEVVKYENLGNIFGQEEYTSAYKITGMSARPGVFNPPSFHEPDGDEDTTQNKFSQQRGLKETETAGQTVDIRQTRERIGSDELPEPALGEGPRITGKTDVSGKVVSSYDD